jgi:hypothetical protein
LVRIDLEDNRYGARRPTDDPEVYIDCLRRAAGRHVENYPTIARMLVERAELVAVGRFDYEANVLTVTDRQALVEWLRPAHTRPA